MRSLVFETYTYAEIAPDAWLGQSFECFRSLGLALDRAKLFWMTPALSFRAGVPDEKTVARLTEAMSKGKIRRFGLDIFREGQGYDTTGGEVLASVQALVKLDRGGDAKGFGAFVSRPLSRMCLSIEKLNRGAN